MSFSLLGDNASGGQKAGKKKRRKRNRKKKTKTSSNNNGTEAKKTAPTPAAASATSAPAAAPSGASKLGAIVDVVSKIHKNFGKDKIASVAAKLAKKGKGVNAKDVVSALKNTVCDFCTLFYRLNDTISNYRIRFLSPLPLSFISFPFLFFPIYVSLLYGFLNLHIRKKNACSVNQSCCQDEGSCRSPAAWFRDSRQTRYCQFLHSTLPYTYKHAQAQDTNQHFFL